MAEVDDELQIRVCRACGREYKYPLRHSLATRFHCEDCMELPAAVRGTFEQFNKRIKTLTATVEKLQKQLAGAAPAGKAAAAKTESKAPVRTEETAAAPPPSGE